MAYKKLRKKEYQILRSIISVHKDICRNLEAINVIHEQLQIGIEETHLNSLEKTSVSFLMGKQKKCQTDIRENIDYLYKLADEYKEDTESLAEQTVSNESAE